MTYGHWIKDSETDMPSDEELANYKEWINGALTEVLGYGAKDADRFVVEPAGPAELCFYDPAHSDWVYRAYYHAGNILEFSTPFTTGYEFYAGEGAVRNMLLTAD